MPRKRFQCYPDLTAFTSFLDEHGGIITPEVLAKAIRKHRGNSGYNLKLCERYEVLEEGVPIFRRKPRFADDNGTQLNNRLNNDFFSSRPTRACELKSPSAPAAPSRPTRVCRLKLYRDLQIKVKPQYSEFTNNSQDKKWHDRKAASNLKKEAA